MVEKAIRTKALKFLSFNSTELLIDLILKKISTARMALAKAANLALLPNLVSP